MEKKKGNIDLESPGFINDDIHLNGGGDIWVSQEGFDIKTIGIGDDLLISDDIMIDSRENTLKNK